MNGCSVHLHRVPQAHHECARDSIPDVDPMRIDVHIDDHSEAPLEHWQDRLKEQRRKRKQPPPQEVPERKPPPDALIDDYAAPASAGRK